jgi:hypothetical protein
MRKVSWDCLVSFDGSRYSVPWQYAAKRVWLRPSQGTKLLIRNQGGLQIALHKVSDRKGATVIEPAHYEGIKKGMPKTRVVLEESFLRLFPNHRWFIEGVLIQHRNNGVDHLRAILALAEVYSYDALIAAFALAREYKTYSHRFIRGLLESNGAAKRESGSPTSSKSNSGPGPSSTLRQLGLPISADLDVYQRILEAGQ